MRTTIIKTKQRSNNKHKLLIFQKQETEQLKDDKLSSRNIHLTTTTTKPLLQKNL